VKAIAINLTLIAHRDPAAAATILRLLRAYQRPKLRLPVLDVPSQAVEVPAVQREHEKPDVIGVVNHAAGTRPVAAAVAKKVKE
jgi:hypothetical protein